MYIHVGGNLHYSNCNTSQQARLEDKYTFYMYIHTVQCTGSVCLFCADSVTNV